MPEHAGTEATWLADTSITKQDAYDHLVGNVVHQDLDQTNMASTVGVVSVGGAPATDGHAAWNNPGGSNDATRQLEVYHSGLSRTVGIPKKHVAWASLPATGDIGEQFYVTDLQITVEWRDATADAVLSGTGLAGWHPVAAGLMLVVAASDVTANRVVAYDKATGTRTVAHTTLMKQQNVLGVALHAFTTGNKGIIALPGYGNPVQVQVDPTVATGDVDAGDWLATTSATAGTARSVGTATTSGIPSAGQMIVGVPSGAFAVSLEDRASGAGAGLVMAKMLPAVGTGAHAFMDETLVWSDTTAAGSASVEACQASTNTNAGQSGTDDTFINAKHLPLMAARITVSVSGTMAAGGSLVEIELGPTAGIESARIGFIGQGNGDVLGGSGTAVVPTRSAGSSTVIGNRFDYFLNSTNMTSVDVLTFSLAGYIF